MASEPGVEIDWAWLRRLEPKFVLQWLMNSLPIRDRFGNQLLAYPVFNMAAKPGIEDTRSQNCKKLHWKQTSQGDHEGDGVVDLTSIALSCNLRSENFVLIVERSKENQLNVIFPQEGHWLEDLIAIASFLHAQGLKTRPRGVKFMANC